MESVLNYHYQWFGQRNKTFRIVALCALLMLFSVSVVNIVFAYDFSGGYLSIKTIGESGMGENILTIGATGSSSTSLDLGMEGERVEAPTTPSSTSVGTRFLKAILPITIAGVLVISIIRGLGTPGIFIGTIVGLIAFYIVTVLLNILL